MRMYNIYSQKDNEMRQNVLNIEFNKTLMHIKEMKRFEKEKLLQVLII